MTELRNQVNNKAELAVQQFQERANGKLDYSVQSLTVVETMLAEASEWINEMPPHDIDALVSLFSAYILAVASRQFTGEFLWLSQHNQPVFEAKTNSGSVSILAHSKVEGRLRGDPADNIPYFYAGFANRVQENNPDDKALYV